MRKVPYLAEFAATVMGLANRVFAAPMLPIAEKWIRCLRPPARLWVENYGRNWVIGDHPFHNFRLFSPAKLSHFLHREFYPRPQSSKRNYSTASVSLEAARTDSGSSRQNRCELFDGRSAPMAVCAAEADLSCGIEFAIFTGNAALARTEQTLDTVTASIWVSHEQFRYGGKSKTKAIRKVN